MKVWQWPLIAYISLLNWCTWWDVNIKMLTCLSAQYCCVEEAQHFLSFISPPSSAKPFWNLAKIPTCYFLELQHPKYNNQLNILKYLKIHSFPFCYIYCLCAGKALWAHAKFSAYEKSYSKKIPVYTSFHTVMKLVSVLSEDWQHE